MRIRNNLRATALLVVLFLGVGVIGAPAAWEPGTQFGVGEVSGRPCLIDPAGRPFKSVGMVWAYGPERGPLAGELTAERVIRQCQDIKDLGFNTLNLYGDRFLPEMLAWCDENELAVYFRTAYVSFADLPGELKEFPDYMDPELRRTAREYYRKNYIDVLKGHPSVLAIDMDHRWLFPLDWSGARRFDEPKLQAKAAAYFPKWLAERYGDIGNLNGKWGTTYGSFDDVLRDPKLVSGGRFRKLENHPARVDVYLYALWTAEDFLRELCAFLQSELPGVLITPTTEHPECLPDVNPDPSTGIAFMSPVHYNGIDDFSRDLPSLCKLIYETRWHYDMQGGPVYISETGFRTSTLEQNPPVVNYAWAEPPTEENAARMYAAQFALMNVLPWLGGYGYFMLYDKWPEGDFGYLRDDGTKKPMALAGDAINRAFAKAVTFRDPEPQVWIYYPDYAQASHRPGFQQLKTWVAAWEYPFLSTLGKRVDQYGEGLMTGDPNAGAKFGAVVSKDFRKFWRGFAFTRTIPDDNKPVVLLSTISEILSDDDREALRAKKTITFGAVGVRDRFMKETEPWFLSALGLSSAQQRERFLLLNLTNAAARPVEVSGAITGTNLSPWRAMDPAMFDRGIPCDGQVLAVPSGRYLRVEMLAGSSEGNAAPFCRAEYSNGERRNLVMGPTIGDMRFEPVMTDHVKRGDTFLSRILMPLEPSLELRTIELPRAPWVRLCGVVLVEGGAAANCRIGINNGNEILERVTPWWLRLTDAPGELRVLESFAGGDPAVVARGTHVAFLFDPLTWAGKTNEISGEVEWVRKWIDESVNYLRKAKSAP